MAPGPVACLGLQCDVRIDLRLSQGIFHLQPPILLENSGEHLIKKLPEPIQKVLLRKSTQHSDEYYQAFVDNLMDKIITSQDSSEANSPPAGSGPSMMRIIKTCSSAVLCYSYQQHIVTHWQQHGSLSPLSESLQSQLSLMSQQLKYSNDQIQHLSSDLREFKSDVKSSLDHLARSLEALTHSMQQIPLLLLQQNMGYQQAMMNAAVNQPLGSYQRSSLFSVSEVTENSGDILWVSGSGSLTPLLNLRPQGLSLQSPHANITKTLKPLERISNN